MQKKESSNKEINFGEVNEKALELDDEFDESLFEGLESTSE